MYAEPEPEISDIPMPDRRTIVVFNEPGDIGTLLPLADALNFSAEALAMSDSGGWILDDDDDMGLEVLPTLGVAVIEKITPEDLEALQKSGRVFSVLEDHDVGIPEELQLGQSIALKSGPPERSILSRIGISEHYPYTGENVTVAIIDTGVDITHPDLSGRIHPHDFKDFTDTKSVVAIDDHGHGTHVTGIVGGPRIGGAGYGVAPRCRLVIGRALRNRHNMAVGLLSDVLKAAEWAVKSRKARIISMSLGIRAAVGQVVDPALKRIADNLVDSGAILVAAVGNDSRRADLPPFIMPVRQPASWGLPTVIGVGAVDTREHVAEFSNGGTAVAVVAPGTGIYSAWPPSMGTPYAMQSGTSQACPIVAGVLALDLHRNPQLSSRMVIENLLKNAKPLPHALDTDVGAGLVQAP